METIEIIVSVKCEPSLLFRQIEVRRKKGIKSFVVVVELFQFNTLCAKLSTQQTFVLLTPKLNNILPCSTIRKFRP